MSNIYDNTLYYKFLRTSVGFVYSKFFRQIEIRGTENIPTGEPVIFAANHQNALLDALAILFFQKNPIVFMARADMFQNQIAARILKSFKIAPIYRIRDGFENLAKNEKQMNGAVNVLLDRKQLCLMPEGNQGHQHKLRPLVKGLIRIAYTAEERLNDDAHVKIIPVGIDYNYYQHAGSDLVVTYGEPIQVHHFFEYYKENQANGLNVLRDELALRMSALMLDIRSTEHYDMIYRLCCYGTFAYLDVQVEKDMEMNAATMAGLRFEARCALAKLLDQIDTENPGLILELNALCRRLESLPGNPSEVAEWMEDPHSDAYIVLLMGLSIPLIPGFLMNFPAWYITRLICKSIEDTQMHCTFKLTIGMFSNAIVYMLVTWSLSNIINYSAFETLVTFIFVTALGIISERARQALRIPMRRFLHLSGKKKKMVEKCKSDYLLLKVAIKRIVQG